MSRLVGIFASKGNIDFKIFQNQRSPTLNQRNRNEIIVFLMAIILGVCLRIYFQDLPNFAPVAALALFAGYFFSRAYIAISVPFLVMAISDIWIGSYHPIMMAIVYTMLALPVALRGILRRWFQLQRVGQASSVRPALALVACGIGASVLFFLTTNLAHWVFFPAMYERSWLGIVECYLAAIPFFKYTLAGDLFFAITFFAGFAVWPQFFQAKLPEEQDWIAT